MKQQQVFICAFDCFFQNFVSLSMFSVLENLGYENDYDN